MQILNVHLAVADKISLLFENAIFKLCLKFHAHLMCNTKPDCFDLFALFY